MKDKRRELRAYRNRAAALKRKARRNNTPCSLCGLPFDWTLPYTDPMSFTADHVTALAQGGHILGPLRPAHRKCNSARGDGTRVARIPTTRSW